MATRLHGDGQILVDWMHEHDIDLSSRPGVPTHDHGNTLDLVWSNVGALADVSIELDSTSDHCTLAGDVLRPNTRGSTTMKISQPYRINDNALDDFAKALKIWGAGLGQ